MSIHSNTRQSVPGHAYTVFAYLASQKELHVPEGSPYSFAVAFSLQTPLFGATVSQNICNTKNRQAGHKQNRHFCIPTQPSRTRVPSSLIARGVNVLQFSHWRSFSTGESRRMPIALSRRAAQSTRKISLRPCFHVQPPSAVTRISCQRHLNHVLQGVASIKETGRRRMHIVRHALILPHGSKMDCHFYTPVMQWNRRLVSKKLTKSRSFRHPLSFSRKE